VKRFSKIALIIGALLLLGVTAHAVKRYVIQPGNLLVKGELKVSSDVDLDGTTTHTLGAAEKVLVDADTTNHTGTAGALDINLGTVTADASGLHLAVTQDNGTAAGVNSYAGKIVLTQNDADGDLDGLLITAAATANAAAGSYEYAIAYDCAENTAGACLDGILITSSGVDVGLTDGLDVSAANIANAVNIGVNPIAGGNSDSFTAGATDASFIYTRDDSGSVTYTCADDDANATCIYDSGGTGNVQIGSADTAVITLQTDDTGDGTDLVLPENAIQSDEFSVMYDSIVFCGQQANTGTIYGGPADDSYDGGGSEFAIGGTVCDGLDNATEATADAPISIASDTAFKVTGMLCKVSGAGSNGVVLTLRTAEGDLTPSVTCTVGTGATTCSTTQGSTTDIAAGATMAVKAVNTEDLSAQDFWCKVGVAYK